MIPRSARPHEVAILTLWLERKNPKQIAYILHYKKTQPVRRVIARYEELLNQFEPTSSNRQASQ